MMNHQEWNSSSRSNSTLVDVSSFFLFESTGDSEFDSNSYSTSDPMDSFITSNPSHQRFLEDDDAQSCSYECGVVNHDEDMELDFQIENDNDGDLDTYSCSRSKSVGWNSDMEDDEDEDEDDDEGGVVEQRWMNGVNRCNKKSKSNVCSVVDSELKSQKDKDKLFWETCLAS
ncbi:hypothetical protein HAX54_045716 [Datura stramonium]|uniref:Uncharacterized protein n=1 Tax=Datura stramonium TaxID=4076 RepID=A0ABS8SQG4_DATST|nr:hypothetical protein [Datura stramonium]